MRLGIARALAATLLVPTMALAQAAPMLPPGQRIAASKIVLVGDSTVAVSSGWGGTFCSEHVTAFVACVNLARGGRSSASYREEGSWDLALSEMRTPGFVRTWVLIQFGHNDQPGKPGRSTDLTTQFPINIARYVRDARAAGAIPVLVTPLTRRTFRDGVLPNDLEPWAAAMRKVAAALNVPLIDLNAKSVAAVQAMGQAGADRLAEVPPPPQGTLPAPAAVEANDRPSAQPFVRPFAMRRRVFDRTHLGYAGARYFATMMAHELSATVPEMRPLLYDAM